MGIEGWQISGNLATHESTLGIAHVDLDSPSKGVSLNSEALHIDPLFAFLISDLPNDIVVRGNDLTLRIPARSSDLVSYEMQYRVASGDHALELILSAQTQLLDSQPKTKVVSRFHSADLIQPGNHHQADQDPPYCVVRPAATDDVSLLVMVHPSDFHRASVDADAGKVTYWVFQDPLEKGVIRRARFRLQLLDRCDDEQQASELFLQSKTERPPLTK